MGKIIEANKVKVGQNFIRNCSIGKQKCVCLVNNKTVLIFGKLENFDDKLNNLTISEHCKRYSIDISDIELSKAIEILNKFQNIRVDSYDMLNCSNLTFKSVSVSNNKLNQKLYKDIKTGEDDEYIYY